ncbi:DUF4249 domain-containing protein [Marivirga salinae]|uniref:DUF4249 domain-containing protein n=1 Tax=Marivirga salinarum TaxID=3059078 RepID=A0AA51NA08_9BACT|nr:DUF4249 domain-containing protein [Marivirga sp. BDSF4-3]WMN11449.1 DUF4249 domain-containing protein [Marivirga sp. BDSF4-3]
MRYTFIPLLFLMLLVGCIDEFNTDISSERSVLVVEARLSNNNDFTKVLLSRSTNINDNSMPVEVLNANVKIVDNLNNQYQMQEAGGTGKYMFESNPPQLIQGNSYQLHIQLDNGEEFLSESVIYNAPIEIGEINIDFEMDEAVIGGEVIMIPFLNFNETFEVQSNEHDTLYFYHDYEGIYAFQSPYQGSSACYPGGTRDPSEEIEVTCYKFGERDMPSNINYAVNNSSYDLNLLHIRPRYKFLIGYSMRIRRHRVSKSFFEYMTNLKKQANYGGSIFEVPPFKVEGNVENVNNPKAPALGFFSVESVNYSNRIFIDRNDINGPIYENTTSAKCANNLDNESATEEELLRPAAPCCDCRLEPGASDQKPEIWPN